MKLVLPLKILKRIKRELRWRSREIGGVLVGEHVAEETFRIVDISVQRSGGTLTHFVRDPEYAKAFLADFFARTGNEYLKFNYIGEWHSHVAFEPLPSGPDFATMYDLVEDTDVGINFAVLLIARMRLLGRLDMSATLFRAGLAPEAICVEVGDRSEDAPRRLSLSRLLGVIRT